MVKRQGFNDREQHIVMQGVPGGSVVGYRRPVGFRMQRRPVDATEVDATFVVDAAQARRFRIKCPCCRRKKRALLDMERKAREELYLYLSWAGRCAGEGLGAKGQGKGVDAANAGDVTRVVPKRARQIRSARARGTNDGEDKP